MSVLHSPGRRSHYPHCKHICPCVDPADESEQVGASGSLEGHAHSRPDATSGDIQDKRQGLLIPIRCFPVPKPVSHIRSYPRRKLGPAQASVFYAKVAQVSMDTSVRIFTQIF